MYDQQLEEIEDGLRRLKVEYDIFFNGHRRKPPDDLRLRVEKIVKRLSEASNMSFPQRFRYNTLVARYYVMRDLWRRTIAARESAKDIASESHFSRNRSSREGNAPMSSGEGIRVSIADPEAEKEKVVQLYDALLGMRGKHPDAKPNISFQQFAKYISTQTQNIRGRHQCSSVIFSVSVEEDAVKFTAKADA